MQRLLQLILAMPVILCPLSLAAQTPPLPPTATTQAERHYQAARAQYDAGNYDAAIGKAQAAILADPEHWQAWQLIGSARHALGDVRGAIRAYHRSLRINPDNPTLEAFVERQSRRRTPRGTQYEPQTGARFPLNPDKHTSIGLSVIPSVGGKGNLVLTCDTCIPAREEVPYDVTRLGFAGDLRIPVSNDTTLFLGFQWMKVGSEVKETTTRIGLKDSANLFSVQLGVRIYFLPPGLRAVMRP